MILAGGQSRRFGSDKALARLGGQTLLQRVATSLSACPRRLLLTPPHRYDLSGWTVQSEQRVGEGPLAALETALAWAEAEAGASWVALTGVDYPLLTPAVWEALAGAIPTQRELGVIGFMDSAGQPEPLPALYHTALLPAVTAALDRGERRLRLPELMTVGYWALPEALGISAHLLTDADTPQALAALDHQDSI